MRTAPLLAVSLVFCAGCSSQARPSGSVPPDAGVETGHDSGRVDAGHDAPADTYTEPNTGDAAPDSPAFDAADAARDSSATKDGGNDATLDAGADSNGDAGADSSGDAGPTCRVIDHVDLTSDASVLRGAWALDGNGNPVVAFEQNSSISAPIAVARRSGGTWKTIVLPGTLHLLLGTPIIRVAVDSTGVVHIAFVGDDISDGGTSFGLYYVALHGNTFGPVETVRRGLIARSLDLLVASDDVPELLFDDTPGATSANVVSARRVNGTWTVAPTGCSVPNNASLSLAAVETSAGRMLALDESAVPDGSAPDTIEVANAAGFGSAWSCQQIDQAPRSSVSAGIAVALATSPDGADATLAYYKSTGVVFSARTLSGWSAAPANGLSQVPTLISRPAGGGFVSLHSSSGWVVVDRYALGAATTHVPNASAQIADNAYPLFWAADFTDGLHVAYVRPAPGYDSELVEAVCTGL